MATDKLLQIIQVSLIAPELPDNGEVIQLSALEHYLYFLPLQKRVLFYESGKDYTKAVECLKESLAKALVHFYPFAGRLQLREDYQVELHCNNAGALFAEAKADARLEDIGKIEPCEMVNGLCQEAGFPTHWPWSPDCPLLYIQVTSFLCGGISVGICFNHQVTDGVSFWSFMKAWAEISCGKPMSSPPHISYKFPKTDSKCANLEQDLGIHGMQFLERVPTLKSFKPNEHEPLAIRCFTFDRAKIDELKSRACTCAKSSDFTSYEVVCSYIWWRLSIARPLPPSEKTRFLAVIGGRKRLPSLPQNYFGNGALLVTAVATCGELERGGFEFAAHLVQKCIRAASAHKLQTFANMIMDEYPHKTISPGLQDHTDLVVLGSHNHPVYDVDFGYGKPFAATHGLGGWSDGQLHLFPGPRDKEIHAILSLPPSVMEKMDLLLSIM